MRPNGRLRDQSGDKAPTALGSVLVTGASAGIGRELARVFASKGYDLILAARSRETIAALAKELIAAYGVDVKSLPVDLSVSGAAQSMAHGLEQNGVSVDILVNNAGVLFEGDFSSISLEDHLRLLQIDVVALTSLTRLFLPSMVRRRSGRILNVASTAAYMPVPRLASYAAAKAYVLSLTEALSEELRGTGVTATALCPGFHRYVDDSRFASRQVGPRSYVHVCDGGRGRRRRRVPRRRNNMRARRGQLGLDERRFDPPPYACAHGWRTDDGRRLGSARKRFECARLRDCEGRK